MSARDNERRLGPVSICATLCQSRLAMRRSSVTSRLRNMMFAIAAYSVPLHGIRDWNYRKEQILPPSLFFPPTLRSRGKIMKSRRNGPTGGNEAAGLAPSSNSVVVLRDAYTVSR